MSGLSRRRGKEDSNVDSGDIDDGNIESSLPYLTLLEEVLLIGLKDREGYLSFWNDNISYTLRGLILIELALRGKIAMVGDSARRRFELNERLITVIDSKATGETLLDEALKIMKSETEPHSVSSWIDLLSGETWNLMKMGYQLKQVRERLAKGLVDKGVLRTEHKNFLLFDMATHPLNDNNAKKVVINKIMSILTGKNIILNYDEKYFKETSQWKYLRSIILVCGCYAANVLENVTANMSFNDRDLAFVRVDELLRDFSDFPFDIKESSTGLGKNLGTEIDSEIDNNSKNKDRGGESQLQLQLEVIGAVISIFSNMDSII